MNILVTGSNGQLGTHLRSALKNMPHNIWFTDVEELDITNISAVNAYVDTNQINLVVNCAAYTNVEKAEDEEPLADKINHVAVQYLAQAMCRVDGTLIHISTDYVFGGNKNNTPCSELEPENPTGAYGRTKLAGEKAIVASGCRYMILRTAWLYSEYGKNFVKTMLSLTQTKPQLKVVFDQVGTPTYAGDLASAIRHIILTEAFLKHQGFYNFSNEGVCSWYDFTKVIAALSHHDQCDVQPCHSDEFPSKVIRPSYSVLDKTKIKSLGVKVPYWTDSLAICVNNLLSNE